MTSVTRQILVADDDTHVRQALLVRLEAAGFEVLSASGGQEAIELFDACRPAAVILDANMPAISGLAVCEHIKEDTTGEKVPVIFISGASSTSSDYVERCSVASGGDYFLRKPFETNELVELLTEITGKQEVAS